MDRQDNLAQELANTQVKPHVIAFAGAKHGVGKTSLVVNVAAAMVARGKRVCVFDVDTGLSNINNLLGLRPLYRFEQVLSGDKAIAEVLVKSSEGIVVLSAGFNPQLGAQDPEQMSLLNFALSELEAQFDYFFIDVPTTLTDTALHFIETANSTFLLVNSEPAALTDAFALLKALYARRYSGHLRLVVNQATDYSAATDTYRRFAAVVDKCLKLKVEFGGFVVRDENLPKSLALQMSVLELAANSPASRCFLALADNIIKHIGSEEAAMGLLEYWQGLLLAEATSRSEAESLEKQADVDAPEVANLAKSALSVGELAAQMLGAMKNQLLDQPDLERFTGDFVEAYCEHFGRFPTVFKQLFYRWLESENYAEPRLLELVSTLEALHAMRYQRPLYNLEENVARLVGHLKGQQDQHRGMVEQLCMAYRQAFHEDVFDAEQLLLARIQSEEYSEQRFEALLQNLRNSFEIRFRKPYQSQHELKLGAAVEALQVMGVDQQNLQDEVSMLMHGLQLLGSRRDKLLNALTLQPGDHGVLDSHMDSGNPVLGASANPDVDSGHSGLF